MMSKRVHPQARLTLKIRQEIKDSGIFHLRAANVCNILRVTAEKGLKRADVHDRSHGADILYTIFRAPGAAIFLPLSQWLYLSLNELLYVTGQYINADLSRADARSFKRKDTSRLADVISEIEGETTSSEKTLKDYEPGFVHIDIRYPPQMPDES